MKIKKILGVVALAVLVASMCVGIVACTNAKKVKGAEYISESSWKETFEWFAFEEVEFTLKYYSKSTAQYEHDTMIHKTKWTATSTEEYTYARKNLLESKIGYSKIAYKGDKDSAASTCGKKAGKTPVEKYVEILHNGQYANYERVNGEFKYSDGYTINQDLAFITSVKNSYESFEYSKEYKGYIAKGYKEGNALTVYKFNDDGRLIAIYMYSENYQEVSNVQEYTCTTVKTETHIVIEYSAKDIKIPA